MTALLTDNLPLLAGASNGIKKLRELILELAVRGKLVPQDPSDEPASELLKRIAEKKTRLVEECRIKKQKQMAAIADEEKPYDLPDSWMWVRLPEIYYSVSVSGNKLMSSQIREEGIFPVVDQGKKFVAGYTDDESLLVRLPGPVVVFGDHTTERKYIDFNFVAGADGVKILRPVLLDEKFFWWHLVGLKLEGRGYARHFKVLNDAFFALPPKCEQSRIVAKIDELMTLCDRLESQQTEAESAHAQLVQALLNSLKQATDATDFASNWQRLAEHFHTLFTTESSIDVLKQSILQLAVMGKLVPQDPKDEPAKELLIRIAETSTQVVGDGKAKKGNIKASTAAQSLDGVDLPETWIWTKFDDLINPEYPIAYGVLVPGPDVVDGIPFVRIADLDLLNPSLKPEKSISPEVDRQFLRTRLRGGEILMGVVGSIGKLGIAPASWAGANIARAICRLVPSDHVSKDYIIWLLQSDLMRKQFLGDTRTLAQPTLNIGLIRNASAPLPPLAEQYRIVTKVNQLMAFCDQLKDRLTQARQLNEQLASTLVEQAVA